MDVQEVGGGREDWMELAWDRGGWRELEYGKELWGSINKRGIS
jgi:hypothetical protein